MIILLPNYYWSLKNVSKFCMKIQIYVTVFDGYLLPCYFKFIPWVLMDTTKLSECLKKNRQKCNWWWANLWFNHQLTLFSTLIIVLLHVFC